MKTIAKVSEALKSVSEDKAMLDQATLRLYEATAPKPKIVERAKLQCYGRVNDLESMVPSNWWKTVFADSIYLKTDGDVVEDPEITREEIGMLAKDADIRRIFHQGANGDGGLCSAHFCSQIWIPRILTSNCNITQSPQRFSTFVADKADMPCISQSTFPIFYSTVWTSRHIWLRSPKSEQRVRA